MQKPTIQSVHKEYYHFEEPSIMSLIQQFDSKTKEWKFLHYRCKLCDNSFKSVTTAIKHHSLCKIINTTKKRKDPEVPIQVVTIKGERYYKWGDSGKPYKNRADAEKQARAAYASGYKEPKKDMEKK